MKEERGSPRGELAPVRATERGLQYLSFLIVNPSPSSLRDATSPQGEAFMHPAQIQNLQSYELCGILDIEKDNRPQGGLPE